MVKSERGHDVVTGEALVLDALIPEELREALCRRDGAALALAVLIKALAHHAALREVLDQLRVLQATQSPLSVLSAQCRMTAFESLLRKAQYPIPCTTSSAGKHLEVDASCVDEIQPSIRN